MRIADRQNWSLSEAKKKISSSELVLWAAYFDWDMNSFHREDYYLAQISQEVRRVLSKRPNQVKLEPFLIKFENKESKQPSAKTLEEATAESQAIWFGFVGLDRKKI